jgi:hypothetical protein
MQLQVLLEATPGYVVTPCAACRLLQWAPHTSIVMMIREPVSRAVSHFEHCQRAHLGCLGKTKSIEEFVGNELDDGQPLKCMNQSFYGALAGRSGHRRMLATKAAVKAIRNATQQRLNALLPAVTWQQCFTGCVFASRRQGMRCPGIDQDVPASRGLYVHQLRWWQELFPKNLMVVNYHKVMDDPHQEIRRVLAFITSGSSDKGSTAIIEEFLQQGSEEEGQDDAEEEQEEEEKAAPKAEPVKLKKVPGVVKHERSEEVLHSGQNVLRRLHELYTAHNAGLAELLLDMGQEHALYNSTSVFPDPWEDLKLARRTNKA